jgi:hypothetical protein
MGGCLWCAVAAAGGCVEKYLLEHSVLHADETPVSMLAPGKKKTHKAYVWAYCTTPFADLKAAIYDFAPSRAGEHARTFLGDWRGKLVCDDYAGYKAGFGNGITEIGCMAHARRKFYDLHEANKSELAAKALEYIGGLYEIERETKDLPPDMRRKSGKPSQTPCRCAASVDAGPSPESAGWLRHGKALDYSLKRWEALTRYLDDGAAHRQQLGGKPDPTLGAGAQQLAVCGFTAQWSTRLRS